jgi:DNA-binding GntR family transcriptional regulator
MHRLYHLSETLDTLESREAIMQAMDDIEAVYDALNDIDRDVADEVMARLLKRLDQLAPRPSG